MEHLNRRFKFMIGNLKSNAKPSAIQRIAKSLGIVQHVCETFQNEAEIRKNKGYSSYPSFADDFQKILMQLEEESIFTMQDNRKLESYNNQPLLSSIKWKNVKSWVKGKLLQLDVY